MDSSCNRYSCSKGDVVIWEDAHRVIASSDITTHVDEETGLHIATCECFNRVGQGRTKDEATRSLKAVLSEYLSMQRAHERLTGMLEKPPWTREIITVMQADELVRGWRQREDRCVVIVAETRDR